MGEICIIFHLRTVKLKVLDPFKFWLQDIKIVTSAVIYNKK